MNTEYLSKEIDGLASDPSLTAFLEECEAAATDADKDVRLKLAEEGARFLLDVRNLRKELAAIESAIEAKVARVMPTGKIDLPDLHVERKGGKDRKEWDTPRLVGVIARNYAGQNADGDAEVADLAEKAVRHFLDYASVGYFRTTALRGAGLDPDDFCEATPGRHTVHVTGGEA